MPDVRDDEITPEMIEAGLTLFGNGLTICSLTVLRAAAGPQSRSFGPCSPLAFSQDELIGELIGVPIKGSEAAVARGKHAG